MPEVTITHLETVSSTNEYALEHIESLPDRHIVTAEIQTDGKGRYDRHWFSSVPGNIYASFVLKPETHPEGNLPLTALSQYLGLSISETLDYYGISATLKWPNDVLVEGEKIAGVLGRSGFHGNRLAGIILGIGINLNMTPGDLAQIDQPATSLNILTGTEIDDQMMLERLTDRFFSGYEAFLLGGFPSIRDSYIERCSFMGSVIRVLLPDREIIGEAEGFNENGFLVVKDVSGLTQTITAGDVLLARDCD